MKSISQQLMLFFLSVLLFPFSGNTQDSLTDEVSCQVNRIYPHLSITEAQLNEAVTISDLDRMYKPSWVKEYISVELSTLHQGKIKKSLSQNDTLSQAQKRHLKMADVGADVSMVIRYIPDNTLSHNDIKTYSFTVKIDPQNQASYVGSTQRLEQYLQEAVLNKIPENSLKGYDLAAVNFTVSNEGEIVDTQLFNSAYQTYKNEAVESLLLEALRKMPCWIPASYSDGTKVQQNFALTVGNHKSCVVNILNIRRLPGE